MTMHVAVSGEMVLARKEGELEVTARALRLVTAESSYSKCLFAYERRFDDAEQLKFPRQC
jgi:hypothetical protein